MIKRRSVLKWSRVLRLQPWWCFCTMFVVASCANYYQQQSDFNDEFLHGKLPEALSTLQRDEHAAYGKSKFIFYVNNGLLLSVLGKYQESNDFFEKAFLFGEDYHVNYVREAESYIYNPTVEIYRGEDHEHLMVLYYKAINFLKMGKPDDALVECKRMDIRLQQLSDKYNAPEKYKRDAFLHTLMGIIYQSTKDYNNAFIAYRNAVDIYESDYARMFGITTPLQLKTDLLNTAWWTGFNDEVELYKTKFNMADYQPVKPEADLVFFWHDGLCPVKDEWSVNFFIEHQTSNMVVFYNRTLGLGFPFQVDDERNRSALQSLEVFRVAFPRYLERPLYFSTGTLQVGDRSYTLEPVEDISKIAFYSLRKRMVQEFGKGLLRAALKKATEHAVKKENETLGAVIGMVNALTEKADTRNWQTLPHSIFYARVPLKPGQNSVTLTVDGEEGHKSDYNFTYTATEGQTLFHTFSSLEALPVAYRN